MPSFVIRNAQLADVPTIVDFNRRLASETEGKELAIDVLGKGVEAIVKDPAKGEYFVAEQEGKIIGQIMYTREWSDWRNGDLLWIQSVYVRQDFRKQGVFRGLCEHLRTKSVNDPNVVGLRLYVEQDNAVAQETYRRIGFVKPGYQVMEYLK